MNKLHVAILGAVQGVTEFLPISSDGHLVLFQSVFFAGEGSLALDVALHIGTLGSIFLFFGKDLLRLVGTIFSSEATPERALERRRLFLIILVTIPTGIIGLLLKEKVESLNASMMAAGIGFFITAAFLFAGERGFRGAGKSLMQVQWWHAIVLGIIQGGAVWPGWSRSGSTIATALLLGWKWEEAGRFSFLMAIPAICGATLLTLKDIAGLDLGSVLVGGIVSFVVGCFSLVVLMKFLASRRLWPFAVYCAAMGLYAVLR